MTTINIQLAYDFGTGVDFGDSNAAASIDNYVDVAAQTVASKFPGSHVHIEVGSGNVAEIIMIDGDDNHEDIDTVRDILVDIFTEDWLVGGEDTLTPR